MKVIGITGGFGTGKTFVASIFRSLGAKTLDADRIAHDVMKRSSRPYKDIVAAFGSGILGVNGDIDRKKLARIVFNDSDSLGELNRIIHPEVIAAIKEKIRKAKKSDVIAIDAPLLIEANAAGLVDLIIVVKASRRKQIRRCVEKFCMTENEVMKRLKGQLPIGRKIKLADFVIDNDGTKAETTRQVKKIWRKIYGDS